MAKEPHSSPQELPEPSRGMQGEGLCLESNWRWGSLLYSVCKLGRATLRSALMVVSNRKNSPRVTQQMPQGPLLFILAPPLHL